MRTTATPAAIKHAHAFLMEPDSAVEDKLIEALNSSLMRAGFAPFDDGFIEWGCVEHGVIHWLVAAGQQWIEFDPRTGLIETV